MSELQEQPYEELKVERVGHKEFHTEERNLQAE